MRKIIRSIIIVFFISSIFSGCTLEYKLAEESGRRIEKASLMVIFPDQLFLKNSKTYAFPNNLSDSDYYFAQIDSSFFLKNISDSIYLSQFSNKVISYLTEFGFEVYNTTEWDEFFNLQNQAFIIDFSQLEIEEFWKVHLDEEEMPDGYTYSEEFFLNTLAFNSWIVVSKASDTALERNVIYSEYLITDGFDGVFLMNNISGEVYYDYNYKPLKPEDADDIVEDASLKITLDVLDFLLNSYIEKEMLRFSNKYPERFWRYIPKRVKPSPTDQKSGYIIIQ